MTTAIVVLLSVMLFFQIIFGLAHSGGLTAIKEAILNNSLEKYMGKPGRPEDYR